MRISDWSSDVCSSDLDVDVAVDGAQVLGLDVVAGLDAAVDGLCVPGVRAVLQADAAVDGFQVAVHLAGLGGDAAVHLVDVGAVGRRGHGPGSQQQPIGRATCRERVCQYV